MRNARTDTLVTQTIASVARTVSGSGAALNVAQAERGATVIANVTAVAGVSPSLVLALQESHDGTTWANLATSPTITAAGVHRLAYNGPAGPFLRLAWTIGGTTPSFTFDATLREH